MVLPKPPKPLAELTERVEILEEIVMNLSAQIDNLVRTKYNRFDTTQAINGP